MSVEIQTPLRFDRLRVLRESRGWSQRELARRSGVGDAQISRYESGLADPTATSLKALAETLNVSLDYLVGLTDNPRGKLGDDIIEGDERTLIEAYRREGQVGVVQWLAEQMKK